MITSDLSVRHLKVIVKPSVYSAGACLVNASGLLVTPPKHHLSKTSHIMVELGVQQGFLGSIESPTVAGRKRETEEPLFKESWGLVGACCSLLVSVLKPLPRTLARKYPDPCAEHPGFAKRPRPSMYKGPTCDLYICCTCYRYVCTQTHIHMCVF